MPMDDSFYIGWRMSKNPVDDEPSSAYIFDCSDNDLTSLKGCPSVTESDFKCRGNKLESLEDGPEEIGGAFDCSHNQLKSLEHCPKKVGKYFNCSQNKLTSLKGVLSEIKGDFYCSDNELSSLKKGPQKVHGDYVASGNLLTSLKGCPSSIRGKADFSMNLLKTLKFGPMYAEYFDCSSNELVSLKYCPHCMTAMSCECCPDLLDISDIPSMCEYVCIEKSPMIEKFPTQIDTTLEFVDPEPEVRQRIKSFSLYEVVKEEEDSITVAIKKIGPQLLDNL